MRINSIKQQSFGANPSRLVRDNLAALADRKGLPYVKYLLSLIKEVHPNKYMTMLGNSEKVYSVGLTDVFDSVAKIEQRVNPEYQEKIAQLQKKYILPHIGKSKPGSCCVIIPRPDGSCERHATKAWEKERKASEKRWQKFEEKAKQFEPLFFKIPVVEEPEGYISLFKDAEGKPFNDIVGILASALEKIKGQRTPKEQALDMIDSMFPAYKNYATRGDVDRANWHHQLIG